MVAFCPAGWWGSASDSGAHLSPQTPPCSCLFPSAPEASLSHSLLGVSPLIRPQGRCIFTNSSCQLFDSPQSSVPFLQGSKNPDSDLWFLQVPPTPPPNHSPSILFSLQELPCARFVAYWHRAFGPPSLSTFLMLSPLSSIYLSPV